MWLSFPLVLAKTTSTTGQSHATWGPDIWTSEGGSVTTQAENERGMFGFFKFQFQRQKKKLHI